MNLLFKNIHYLTLVVCVALVFEGNAQRAISFQAAGGLQVTIPSKLTIKQEGYPDIVKKRAEYVAESFKLPPYWDYGITYLFNRHALGVRVTHYKIIMSNPTEEINRFRVTHGYNSIALFYQYELPYFYVSPGMGIALAHAESTIRGQKLVQKGGIKGTGYYWTGPVFFATIGKKIPITKHLHFFGESRFTSGYVNVPVVDGEAHFWHWSWVLQAGLTLDFTLKD